MVSVADMLGVGSSEPCHPYVCHQVGASILKDEDVLLVEAQRPWPGSGCGPDGCGTPNDGCSTASSARCSNCGAATSEYSLYAVFDGHNGVAAARLVADSLVGVLEERLPQGTPPLSSSPTFVPWREDIQLALVETLAELNKMFAFKGILAGCTATLVLQYGWLLTVANLGDSRAILDTGLESIMLTVDHRVATHKGERRRVEAMGNTIAPVDFSGSGPATRVDNGVGPLRIWPGGLCLSRAIGDFDVGDSVIPFPHLMQVVVPPTGARLLVASDGVWDAYEKMNRISAMMRGWAIDSCPQRLIQSIVRAYGGLRDDTSLVVVDIVPPGKTFPEVAQAVSARQKLAAAAAASSGGGDSSTGALCGCFGGSAVPPPPPMPPSSPASAGMGGILSEAVAAEGAAAQPAPVPTLEVLTDLDVAAVMGLMPDAQVQVPGWYDEYVGEQLLALATEAMEAWQDASEKRTGRRGTTPQLESSVRAARAARAALQSGEAEPLVDSEEAAWAPAPPTTGGMRRAASTFFTGAVADDEHSYAQMFGHYKGFQPASLSESPGSSMHSGLSPPDPAGAGGGALGGSGSISPGGSMHSTSTRSGGYRYVDASVRAGSRFYDASVRAGSRFTGDASVRAGSAFFADNGNSSSHRFRADPSIRAGTAALGMLQQRPVSDSAGSADKASCLAAVADEDSQRAAAAARGSGGSSTGTTSPVANDSASGEGAGVVGSMPIPVPRTAKGVSFGTVKVMGDSPSDVLQRGNSSQGRETMTTIMEG